MPTIGRPRVLDEKKKSQILAFIKSGCGRVSAAIAVNCDPKTIVNTAKRDPEFANKLAIAEMSTELVHLDNINKAGRQVQYWRASAWLLQRLFPDKYGNTRSDTITPSQISSLVVNIAEIIVQEIPADRYRNKILKRLDGLLKEARLIRDPLPNPSQGITLIELSSDVEQRHDEHH
jgi:hypothetical protein